ncbi:uncharacterized protein IL334_001653 [Kwoniella shivajii]|uniref:Myb-like domain-containing protein n=1 Tax=Kwoniella shivajii TaxID=564305 RepID=A0ABZ1CSI2_9TREE|nr:hypothetical protein IL334_001653 [Kwoniella shivajii]
MPAIRDTKPRSLVPNVHSPPMKGWTKDQKVQLFNHIVKNGERNWNHAVDGKTGHQCIDQWKKTLLPQIQRSLGF